MDTPGFHGASQSQCTFVCRSIPELVPTYGAQSTNQQVLLRQPQADWSTAPTISARLPATIRGQESTASFRTTPYKAVISSMTRCHGGARLVWCGSSGNKPVASVLRTEHSIWNIIFFLRDLNYVVWYSVLRTERNATGAWSCM